MSKEKSSGSSHTEDGQMSMRQAYRAGRRGESVSQEGATRRARIAARVGNAATRTVATLTNRSGRVEQSKPVAHYEPVHIQKVPQEGPVDLSWLKDLPRSEAPQQPSQPVIEHLDWLPAAAEPRREPQARQLRPHTFPSRRHAERPKVDDALMADINEIGDSVIVEEDLKNSFRATSMSKRKPLGTVTVTAPRTRERIIGGMLDNPETHLEVMSSDPVVADVIGVFRGPKPKDANSPRYDAQVLRIGEDYFAEYAQPTAEEPGNRKLEYLDPFANPGQETAINLGYGSATLRLGYDNMRDSLSVGVTSSQHEGGRGITYMMAQVPRA